MNRPLNAAPPSSQAPSTTMETIEARNARFDEISWELASRRLQVDEYWRALDEQFPDPQEQQAFITYSLHRSLPHVANPSGVLTSARFVEMADSINFFNEAERKELLPGLEWALRPWIPLGRDKTTLYRLLPAIHNLTPQQSGKFPSTDHEMLDTAFLGVNTTVQPREPSLPLNRRALNLSEQSTQSAESDDIEAPGFVFHELGVLESLECEAADEMPTTFEQGVDCEGDWEPTGFCVVARLGHTGHMDGVYLIYNMNPLQENSLERKQVTHAAWGIPPSSPGEQFSCARIGNSLRDFGFGHQLVWTEQVRHPVELVWAVRSPMGGAMRVTAGPQAMDDLLAACEDLAANVAASDTAAADKDSHVSESDRTLWKNSLWLFVRQGRRGHSQLESRLYSSDHTHKQHGCSSRTHKMAEGFNKEAYKYSLWRARTAQKPMSHIDKTVQGDGAKIPDQARVRLFAIHRDLSATSSSPQPSASTPRSRNSAQTTAASRLGRHKTSFPSGTSSTTTLADAGVLSRVVGGSGDGKAVADICYKRARVRRGRLTCLGDKYLALVDADEGSVVDGWAYQVKDRAEEDSFRVYETGMYEVVRCMMEILGEEEGVVHGLTFRLAKGI
ncbi:hypothetical protein V8C44DRAFT_347831 [Trichoderma aethiopicum]